MTDGERKLNESDASLLSIVIDDNEIRGSGWAKSLAGGFKLVGRVVAPPPLPPPLASGVSPAVNVKPGVRPSFAGPWQDLS